VLEKREGKLMTMSWRLATRLSVISLALLVLLVIALFSLRNGTGEATNSGVVNHSSAIYVIDKQGIERALLDNSFSSSQLASDLKILLGE
jgi:hypothetical protein